MKPLILATTFAVFSASTAGCATKSDYVLPDTARKLDTEEIAQVFSDVREHYEAIDDPGLTASILYISYGDFLANWKKGWFFRGRVTGKWYTEDDQLCVKSTTKIDGSDLICVSIYETDGVYTAVHPDGSYQGISTLTPLGDVMSSEHLRRVFIGHTVHGSYPEKDEIVEHWEYFDEDGTIHGRTAKYGDFTAHWEIRDSGCFYSDYDESNKYDGCYYYVHDSGNTYRYHRPWSDEVGQEVLLQGNPERLGEQPDA
ncbi:MAG: hypothetical protein HKN42_03130 [Granulosicoccus sp.]|nr:hypothetical protein [Granulosicoccus sp.]